MIEQRSFPFGGVPVYNPQSLSKEEAIAQFHARQSAYEHLIALLRQERPPHVLIIGTRGMGKTTLLQRVRYGVEEEVELNSRYLVLVFPEEQYNVNQLHRFLLNTVDAVADAMERLHDNQAVSHIEEYAESLGKKTREEIEEEVPQFLARFGGEIHKDFLLLVDNADRLFDLIEGHQQWRLRELLSSRRDLTFFGATTQASDGIYGSDRAFFEFFQIQALPPLTSAEVRGLLLRLSEAVEENQSEKGTAKRRVKEWLEADAARLRTLVELTGGNPRTAILLFHLVLDGLQGGAREYLEQLLDQVTPTYKGRVDELSPQAQQVLDAVALHWDPVTAMEVGSESGLETGVVSTQLSRLVRQGILEKADPGDSKKALYQVAERFFNIWYLMRASRRVRAKLRWFVEFLRVFFDHAALEQIAWDRMERYRPIWRKDPGEVETVFAYVIASGAKRETFEEYLRQNCSDMEQVWKPYLDLMEVRPAIEPRPPKEGDGDTEAQIRALTESEPDNADHLVRLGDLLKRGRNRDAEAESAFRKAIEINPKSAAAWGGLGRILLQLSNRRGTAESPIRRAIELEPSRASYWDNLGDVRAEMSDHMAEAEAAYRKAIELDPKRAIYWWSLGLLLAATPGRAAEAEGVYRKAIEIDPKRAVSWFSLGLLLAATPGRAAEAEAAYRKAIELDSTQFWPLLQLGQFLSQTPERATEAEAVYRRAIELDPTQVQPWRDLGQFLSQIPERATEAEAAYRRAIEFDSRSHGVWHNLGTLLARVPEREVEAEAAYRNANELYSECPGCWHALGSLLAKKPERATEAEAAFRKVIEREPKRARVWNDLGILLAKTPERAAEAEAALRKAIELDMKEAEYWHDLGVLLETTPERAAEAEAAFRKATELNPKFAGFSHHLGRLLTNMSGRMAEAEAVYRRATEVNPESASTWVHLGIFLACHVHKPKDAETAFRTAILRNPEHAGATQNLGVLLYCELGDLHGGSDYLERAHQLATENPIAAAFAVATKCAVEKSEQSEFPIEAARKSDFWNDVLELCRNYPPLGRLLLIICDLVQGLDASNRFVKLYRAVAFGQLGEFPRASVAFEDALVEDPIELLSIGQPAIETILAAAVRSGRVRDILDVLDKKEWRDAWRPIYEALKAVEAGSADYLKRIAFEIRTPAFDILRRIAPALREVPERTR